MRPSFISPQTPESFVWLQAPAAASAALAFLAQARAAVRPCEACGFGVLLSCLAFRAIRRDARSRLRAAGRSPLSFFFRPSSPPFDRLRTNGFVSGSPGFRAIRRGARFYRATAFGYLSGPSRATAFGYLSGSSRATAFGYLSECPALSAPGTRLYRAPGGAILLPGRVRTFLFYLRALVTLTACKPLKPNHLIVRV